MLQLNYTVEASGEIVLLLLYTRTAEQFKNTKY